MNILIGVSGGIAAYKACDIINALTHQGHNVRAVMTENAKHMITEETLASLTHAPVLSNFWSESKLGAIDHIKMQDWADVLLVAPATGNVIGKFANGIADDYLSTIWMATKCPKIVAPAMNTVMWESHAVQRNIKTLLSDGVFIVPPRKGRLACGAEGEGKLAKVEEIINGVFLAFDSMRENRS